MSNCNLFSFCNGNIRKEDTKGRYIFWDIDGTLAPYRFNGHVGDPIGTNNGMSMEEIESGVFLNRKPSSFMQKVIVESEAKQHIVMGHTAIQKETDDKHVWLNLFYPMIKERLFAFEDISKADTILNYCKENDISLDDILYVDDVIPFLREAERKGIPSWHISSFFDYFL